MQSGLAVRVIIVLTGILIAAPKSQGAALNPSSFPEIQDALDSVEEYSDKQGDDLLDDTPKSRTLWAELDRLKNRVIQNYLRRHDVDEPLSSGFLKIEFDMANPQAFDIKRIGKDEYIASTDENIILLSRRSGVPNIIWSARRDAGKYAGRYPFLKAWSDSAKFNDCVGKTTSECGRMTARFGLLPDTASGHHRFILDGFYQRVTAPFLEHQFTIWEWSGQRVRPLLGRTVMGGQDDNSYTVEGEEIHVPFLLRLDMPGFSPTSWIIGVRPNRLEDLGIQSIPMEKPSR